MAPSPPLLSFLNGLIHDFQWANCPFRIDVIVRLHKSSIIPPEFAIRELQIFIIKWLNITIITDKNSANIFSQQLNLSWRFDRLDNPVSGLPSCRFLWIISKNSIKQKKFRDFANLFRRAGVFGFGMLYLCA